MSVVLLFWTVNFLLSSRPHLAMASNVLSISAVDVADEQFGIRMARRPSMRLVSSEAWPVRWTAATIC